MGVLVSLCAPQIVISFLIALYTGVLDKAVKRVASEQSYASTSDRVFIK
jgi:hypothetical protein